MPSVEGTETDHPEVEFDIKERAMDEAPVGITITDPNRPDNPLVYINDAFERVTGYSREEVLGVNCRFLQGPETSEEKVAELARAVEEEESVLVELRNYRKNGEQFWNQVKIAPLRNEAGEVTHFVGFQMEVTERKRAQREVERERENLEHLIDRINGLLSDVTEEVVGAESRDAIEERVCERVVATEPYSFAWVGESDLTADVVRANTWRGSETVSASDLEVERSATDHPVVRALETGEVQAVSAPLPPELVGDEGAAGAAAAVPLVYRGTTYGVLVVATPDADALDERETAVLGALGRTIATALNAHESKRMLSSNNVVEIDLEVTDSSLFFVALSERADCALEYRGSVYRGGQPLLFFTTDGDAARVRDVATELSSVESAAVIGDEAESDLLEFRLSGTSIVSALAERGARTNAITVADGVARIELELPTSADARSVVEQFQERFPATELVGYRETQRPPTTEHGFVADLQATLTDKQLTALQKAYVSGYYESNRDVTGDELADSMGISRSTFHQHLRSAERKLLQAVFEN